MIAKTPIIPQKQTFAKVNCIHELDFKAICVFAAIGFFLDRDTYWKDQVVLPPACNHEYDTNGTLIKSTPYFKWHNTPQNLNIKAVVNDFGELFETIIDEQTKNKPVILPLSGGLDSRSQAVALSKLGKSVQTFSYEFHGGFNETRIARDIANICDFPYQSFKINKGYLWDEIIELSEINQCYSEFTHPRQMAVLKNLRQMGGLFSLGHWGDALFDNPGVDDNLPFNQQVSFLLSKVVKKDGLKLANKLWNTWGLDGEFNDYLHARIASLLKAINIDNANSQIRAFKSLYWAPRWTSVNLTVFEAAQPVTLPYYDNRMCEFICNTPENYLAKRLIQIEYIKTRMPELAKVTWQNAAPFNLFNYKKKKSLLNLPYRIKSKVLRSINSSIGNPYIQRNWELQFLGSTNEKQLKSYLFSNEFKTFVPIEITNDFFNEFKSNNKVMNAHAISMLLTLSVFYKNKVV